MKEFLKKNYDLFKISQNEAYFEIAKAQGETKKQSFARNFSVPFVDSTFMTIDLFVVGLVAGGAMRMFG